eukprot:28657-Pelagococcus_subviridis.AAC.4
MIEEYEGDAATRRRGIFSKKIAARALETASRNPTPDRPTGHIHDSRRRGRSSCPRLAAPPSPSLRRRRVVVVASSSSRRRRRRRVVVVLSSAAAIGACGSSRSR